MFDVSKQICEVIGSGSSGNAVLYHRQILVDCGLPYKRIEPYKNEIQLVLLSHSHSDHLNITTIKKLAFERPALRFACGSFLAEKLEGVKNVDILESGKIYDYGAFKISPITLYHDVPNFGFRILKDGYKIIHCTDTFTLEGITAKDYDLYAIESNYDSEETQKRIERKQKSGQFAYEYGAMNSHLSEEQARDFIFKNKGENSKVVRLHESSNNY